MTDRLFPGRSPPGTRTIRTRWCAGHALAAAALVLFAHEAGAQSTPCAASAGEILVVEGTVERRRDGNSRWTAMRAGERLCHGDTLRVPASSRALLRLPDESTLRVDENTTLLLGQGTSADDGFIVNLLRGLLHVISRDPRQLRFSTPFANAGLEGTEFDIRVDETLGRTEVAVLEGEVKVTNGAGELSVPGGNLAIATAEAPPTAAPLAAPIELMRWASFYPLIVDAPLPQPDREPSTAEARDAEFFARRAAARLQTARLEAARLDLERALALAPEHPTALSLQAMMALARADTATAHDAAARALRSDARSAPALIASSYAWEATGALENAETAAREALATEPNNAVALTRLAVLRAARNDLTASVELAERARALAPGRSTPVAVLGFAELSAFATSAAVRTFDAAIALEPEAPLPRLGRAVAAAQAGDVREARRQLELAVAADPANGLARSYMAALYSAENRTELTQSQLDLAKTFDPNDSTPWLYSALGDLERNQPIQAFGELRAARRRNADTAVFRSRLTLHEDLATRSAALGRIYTNLGFERLALLDAWQGIADTPTDYSSHRLLADVYASEPRHEIARVSELLAAQLLQPANVTPLKPQLGQPSRFLAQRIGPSQSSFDEFTSPVASNGPKLSTSAVVAGRATAGTDVTVAGLNDRLSYSAGHYRFASDGFRANNDTEQSISNVFVQFRPSYSTSLQAEWRSVRGDNGDISAPFDPAAYTASLREEIDADSLRLGASRRLSASATLLASVIAQDSVARVTTGAPFAGDSERAGYSVDVQHLYSSGATRLQSGLLYAQQDEARLERFGPPLPVFEQSTHLDLGQISAYSYWHHDVSAALSVTLGASLDRVSDISSEDAFNPKAGLVWRPTAATTVRVATFKTLFGSLTTSTQNVQPRLEPVQIAGFTQLLFGGQADRSRVRGVGVDHSVSDRVFVGWETSLRDTERAVILATDLSAAWTNFEERTHLAYVFWTPTDRISVSTRYEHGRYSLAPEPIFGYTAMTLDRLPVEARIFTRGRLTAGARVTFVRQSGEFRQVDLPPDAPAAFAPGGDRFVVLDAFASYRLPNRRGLVSLNADNLLDERFQFQDVDPRDASFIPERLISLRFTLAFD